MSRALRKKRVNLSLTEKEYEIVKELAEEEEISISEYFRELMKREYRSTHTNKKM